MSLKFSAKEFGGNYRIPLNKPGGPDRCRLSAKKMEPVDSESYIAKAVPQRERQPTGTNIAQPDLF